MRRLILICVIFITSHHTMHAKMSIADWYTKLVKSPDPIMTHAMFACWIGTNIVCWHITDFATNREKMQRLAEEMLGQNGELCNTDYLMLKYAFKLSFTLIGGTILGVILTDHISLWHDRYRAIQWEKYEKKQKYSNPKNFICWPTGRPNTQRLKG